MSRRTLSAAVLASLLIAACGGSTHSTSSTSTATTAVSAEPTTTTATTSSRPPEVPKKRAPKHSKPPKQSKPTAANTNVRIPAAFIIRAGGAVTPPLISVPANVTIELQLRNHDSHAHRVQLSVAHVATVTVPAHGSQTTDVSGVPRGTYRLLVDGAAKAHIIVGAVPGP